MSVSDEQKELDKELEILRGEVAMLDSMIAEVQQQVDQATLNLTKLQYVRSALQDYLDRNPELPFEEEE